MHASPEDALPCTAGTDAQLNNKPADAIAIARALLPKTAIATPPHKINKSSSPLRSQASTNFQADIMVGPDV
jgi:hypothetical protein